MLAGTLGACSLLSLPESNGSPEAGTAAGEGGVTPDGADGDARAPTSSSDASSGAYAAEVLADNPVAYLRLEESKGPTLRDERGALDAAAMGVVELGVPGVVGRAARLPGTDNSFLDLGDAFDLSNDAPFSIEVWAYVELVDSVYRRLFWKGSSQVGGWYSAIQGAEVLNFSAVRAGQVELQVTYNPLGRNVWRHVVFTYDGAALKLYVDGRVASTANGSTNIPDTTSSLRVGESETGFNPFKGVVDELAFYDKALPADRVKAHFEAVKR